MYEQELKNCLIAKIKEEGNMKFFVYKGLPCLILRRHPFNEDNPQMFHLCGYVGVPKDHPYYTTNYDNNLHIGAHGGLTFSEMGTEFKEIPDYKDYWFFGFDCAHGGDLSSFRELPTTSSKRMIPQLPRISDDTATYKDMDFCINECGYLADQLIIVKIITER